MESGENKSGAQREHERGESGSRASLSGALAEHGRSVVGVLTQLCGAI